MNEKPVINGVYQHFKGNLYLVLDIIFDCTHEKEVVLYCPLGYSNKEHGRFVRDLEDFNSDVDVNRKDNITGQTKRFVLISKPQNSEREKGK